MTQTPRQADRSEVSLSRRDWGGIWGGLATVIVFFLALTLTTITGHRNAISSLERSVVELREAIRHYGAKGASDESRADRMQRDISVMQQDVASIKTELGLRARNP